jgi:hypothetical protein
VVQLRAHDPRFGVAIASERGFTHEAGFFERMPVAAPDLDPVPDALVGHEDATTVVKLLAFHPDHDAHELMSLLPPVLGEGLAVNHMGADAVEIAPAGADKGVGLRWLCTRLGIDASEVVAIGDEINDLPMFRAAGRRVAVENGNPVLKLAADEIVPPNAEDGVAQFVEQLLARG